MKDRKTWIGGVKKTVSLEISRDREHPSISHESILSIDAFNSVKVGGGGKRFYNLLSSSKYWSVRSRSTADVGKGQIAGIRMRQDTAVQCNLMPVERKGGSGAAILVHCTSTRCEGKYMTCTFKGVVTRHGRVMLALWLAL